MKDVNIGNEQKECNRPHLQTAWEEHAFGGHMRRKHIAVVKDHGSPRSGFRVRAKKYTFTRGEKFGRQKRMDLWGVRDAILQGPSAKKAG